MAMVADSDGNKQWWLCHGWEREKKIGEGVWGFIIIIIIKTEH